MLPGCGGGRSARLNKGAATMILPKSSRSKTAVGVL